jgi:hypothetical protein
VKANGAGTPDRRPRVTLPPGRTMLDVALEIPRRHEAGERASHLAKEFRIGTESASIMEEIVAIAGRDDLPPREMRVAQRAVAMMNEEQRVGNASEVIEPSPIPSFRGPNR